MSVTTFEGDSFFSYYVEGLDDLSVHGRSRKSNPIIFTELCVFALKVSFFILNYLISKNQTWFGLFFICNLLIPKEPYL